MYQVVVHVGYDVAKQLKLEECAEQILICEHQADEKVNRTHIHAMLDGVKVSAEAIRKRINKAELGGRGNYGIFTSWKGEPYDRDKLGTYMLKGDKALLRQTNYTDEQIISWVHAWVGFVKREPLQPKKNAKEGVKSHWDIMQEIIAETRTMKGVWSQVNTIVSGDDGIVLDDLWVCNNKKAVWDCMIKHLAKNRIRTSKHELERWYVTMMREEKDTSQAMYSSIMKKLYSEQ